MGKSYGNDVHVSVNGTVSVNSVSFRTAPINNANNYIVAPTDTNANIYISAANTSFEAEYYTYQMSATISCPITGSGGLKKTGGGSLTLTAANTYSGNTSIGDSSIGGGYLCLDGGNNRLPSTVVTVWGNGGFFNLLGNSQEASAVHLYGGTIGYGTLASHTDFDFQSGTLQTMTLNNASGYTVGMNKTSSGTLNIDGLTASYTGATAINAGSVIFDYTICTVPLTTTVQVADLATLQVSTQLEIDSLSTNYYSIIALNDMLTINNSAGCIIGGNITGSGFLIKNGNGTLSLTKSNTSYTGEKTINGGLVQIGNANALGTGALVINGGTLDLNGKSITVNNLSGSGGTITDNSTSSGSTMLTINMTGGSGNFSGAITNPAYQYRTLAVTKTGAGTLNLLGLSTFMGGTMLNGGAIVLYTDNALYSGGNFTISGSSSILNLNGHSLTIGSISGSGSILLGTGTLTVQSGIYSGIINGYGAITKTGSGTLRLTGNSALYAGSADIQGGTLELYGSGALASSNNVNISNGSTLLVTGSSSGLGSISGVSNSTLHVANKEDGAHGQLTVASLSISTCTIDAGCMLAIRPLPGGPQPTGVIGVTSANSNGVYVMGDTISVDVTFDANVNVTGTPVLRLDTGENEACATYSSGSGTSTLRFTYTVQVGDNTSDLDYYDSWALLFNGGTIKDDSQSDVYWELAAPGQTGSLSAAKDITLQTPYLTVSGGSSVAEGKPYTLQLSAANLGSHSIDTWEIDWGDGNTDTYVNNPSQVNHTYADDGYYVITSSAILDDETYMAGGQSGSKAVNVINIAPYLSIRGSSSTTANSPYTLYLSSSDPGDDTIDSWEIDWGDGNVETISGNPSSVQHYYENVGNYSISATATDEDGTYATGGTAGGALDPTFGNGGIVITGFDHNAYAYSVATQSDGCIIVAGTVDDADENTTDFALARYYSDGTLDTDFGNGGTVTTNFSYDEENGNSSDYACAAAVQSDGKIVVAGSSDGDFALARYNADGSLDTGFGNGGMVTTDFSGQEDKAYTMAIQSDGKIVLAGRSNGWYFVLARYNADGSLDANFGSGGKVITQFEAGGADAESLTIQSNGKIVVAGRICNGCYFAVARYNTDGSLDSTFGDDGMVTTEFAGAAYAAAVQSDGKIVVAGYTANGIAFALVRYNADGSLDTSFGSDGKVQTNFGGTDFAYALAIQADGKIIAAGFRHTGNPSNYDFALARYNADGSLDTTFDGDGTVTTNLGGLDIARSMVLQSDGRIVVAGYAMNDFAVARYFPGIVNVTVTVSV